MAGVWFWTFLGLLIVEVELARLGPKTDDDLIVELEYPKGKIQGHILQSSEGNDFYAFQEIPYAAPPVGELRFKEPQPHEGWSDILPTTANTKICIQQSNGPPGYRNDEDKTETEDCLFVNVYTPVKPGGDDKLAVIVWIHGGGFSSGDGTYTSVTPDHYIDYDVIVVTMNYRLGALGFLTTDDENLPGNLGLKDQQLAIKWVYDNIHLFGGNPEKITIAGQSVGSSAVSYQLISKKNQGLLAGVIQESGTALGMTTWQPSFRELAFQFGKAIDSSFNSEDSKDLRDLLIKASIDDIKTCQKQVVTNLTNGVMNDMSWTPIIESDSNPNTIITAPMLESFINGDFNQIPYIIGFTSEEGLGFILQAGNETERAIEYDADPSLIVNKKINVNFRTEVGERLRKLYTDTLFVEDEGAFIRYTTDAGFARPSIRQAVESSKYVPVYLYQFAYSDTRSDIPGTEHVEHGDEMRYFWGDGPIHEDTPVNETIRAQLLTLWTNFIKYQNPTPEVSDLIPISWPTVNDVENILYLNINETLEVRENPKNFYDQYVILNGNLTEPYVLF